MALVEGDTGKGASVSFNGVVINNVIDITTDNTGEIISEDTADGRLTAVVGTGWAWTVTFAVPKTGSHTLINSLKAGTTGALDLAQGSTRYTAATARSGGVNVPSNPKRLTIATMRIAIDGDPTIAAKV
jgi:hypothetical protein